MPGNPCGEPREGTNVSGVKVGSRASGRTHGVALVSLLGSGRLPASAFSWLRFESSILILGFVSRIHASWVPLSRQSYDAITASWHVDAHVTVSRVRNMMGLTSYSTRLSSFDSHSGR